MANSTFHIKHSIEGDLRLQAALDGLARRVQTGVMRKALREASRPIIQQARANLIRNQNIRTRNLYRSIAVRVKTYPRGKTISIIGPRWPMGAHGHLVEFGSGPRWSGGEAFLLVGKGKKKTKFQLRPTKLHYHGQMPASPFLLPAFYAQWRASLSIMRFRAWHEIDLAAKKEAGRAAAA